EGDTSNYDISLLATDGSGELSLVAHPAKDRVLGWLPGTSQLLFLSDRSGSWDVWAVQVAEGKVRAEPRPVRRALGDVEPMGFTQDGSLFYYIYTLRYITSIAPFDEATGQIRTEASEPLLGSTQKPAWSPSGEYLALIRENVLRVRNVTTGEERAVGRQLSPVLLSWFPDGDAILALGVERGSLWEARGESPPTIYRVDVASGETTPLIEFPPDPSWRFGVGALTTSDGEGVIYIHDGRLALRYLSSGREVEFYRHPDLASRVLALSPDGEDLVFGIADSTVDRSRPQVDLGEGGRLMVMPSRGGEIRELVELDAPGAVYSVAWTSDGEHVLYQRRNEDGTALFRVPRVGGETDRVWETEQTIFMLALSPDGRRVAYITRENEAEIWVMENLVAALGEQQ
ncbi:MAG: WD40 repeat domain-containing protein, partial [Gemmatimonadota bacterium]